jgi:hypothetical protein
VNFETRIAYKLCVKCVMSYFKKMNFLKKRKNQKTNAVDNFAKQKNDEEINNLLDPSKLAASLNLKSSTIKFNYFFDDSDIFRVSC